MEKITEQELEAALRRMGYTSDMHAWKIIDNVIAHREPRWEIGDVVRDREGDVYVYLGHNWNRCGSAISHSFETPRRPLKILR